MDPNTQEVTTPTDAQPETQVTEASLSERLAKSYEAKVSATADSAPVETDTPEAPAAAETTEEAEPVEAKPEDTPEPAAEPFTEEQLADPAFFDKLDKEGWKSLEAWNPALYRKAKAVYSALGKANHAAQQAAKAQPVPEEAPAKADQRKALLTKLDSLDDDERAEALDEYVRTVIREVVPEMTGVDPDEAQATRVLRDAHSLAVSSLPDLAKLSNEDLDAAVEADPDLLELLEVAAVSPREQRVRITANVMKRAGQAVLAKQQTSAAAAKAAADAKAAKDAETKKRVLANANNPSTAVAESSAARVPTGKRSIAEVYDSKVRELSGG